MKWDDNWCFNVVWPQSLTWHLLLVELDNNRPLPFRSACSYPLQNYTLIGHTILKKMQMQMLHRLQLKLRLKVFFISLFPKLFVQSKTRECPLWHHCIHKGLCHDGNSLKGTLHMLLESCGWVLSVPSIFIFTHSTCERWSIYTLRAQPIRDWYRQTWYNQIHIFFIHTVNNMLHDRNI